jgi:hypothetical protein
MRIKKLNTIQIIKKELGPEFELFPDTLTTILAHHTKSHDYSMYQYKHTLNLNSFDVLQQHAVGSRTQRIGKQKTYTLIHTRHVIHLYNTEASYHISFTDILF